MTKDETLKLALSTLNEVRSETLRLLRNGQKLYAEEKVWNTITAIEEALAQQCVCGEPNSEGTHRTDGPCLAPQPEQEPVAVDKTTMELAESVGLIGPASRSNDLHGAIQRFHDLICVNATIKAAQMAADVIQDTTPPQRKPLTDEQIEEIAKEFWLYPRKFVRAIEAAHNIKGEA